MDAKLRQLQEHVAKTIGLEPDSWPSRPQGYPDRIEAALIDSVFSLRAVYGTSRSVGPRAVVQRWQEAVSRPLNSLRQLVADVDGLGGPDEFRRVLKHDGVAVPNAPDKPSKALAVYDSSVALARVGVDTADDARKMRSEAEKELLRAIRAGRGVGLQAATYFLMNLGVPGVKADVMVKKFVSDALGEDVSEREAADLVSASAALLAVDLIHLDHAIWMHGSEGARSRRRRGRSPVADTF